jgi:molybdate/tungstate transport system substrate-binding protein
MNKSIIAIIVAVIVVAAVGVIVYDSHSGSPKPLVVYVADAYTSEAQLLASGFHNTTGKPTPIVTGGGSFTLAQEIGMGQKVDVFVPVAISAVTQSYLHSYSPGWAVAFAADQMVIAYTNSSTTNNDYAKQVLANYSAAESHPNTSRYWYNFFKALSSGRLKLGISNPNSDPAGFRAWIVLEAAGYLYANNSNMFVDSILSNHANYTASNAAQLVAPLTAGQINFLFIYRSSAIAKHLYYLELPPQINLGDPSYAAFYSKFNYTLATGVVEGSPIYLYITVPLTSPQPALAEQFVVYVVQNAGLLVKYGLTPLEPAYLYNSTTPPTQIAQLMSGGYLKYAGSL